MPSEHITVPGLHCQLNYTGEDTMWGLSIHKALLQDMGRTSTTPQLLDEGGPEQLRAKESSGWLRISVESQWRWSRCCWRGVDRGS